jgi:hypothetical protein
LPGAQPSTVINTVFTVCVALNGEVTMVTMSERRHPHVTFYFEKRNSLQPWLALCTALPRKDPSPEIRTSAGENNVRVKKCCQTAEFIAASKGCAFTFVQLAVQINRGIRSES